MRNLTQSRLPKMSAEYYLISFLLVSFDGSLLFWTCFFFCIARLDWTQTLNNSKQISMCLYAELTVSHSAYWVSVYLSPAIEQLFIYYISIRQMAIFVRGVLYLGLKQAYRLFLWINPSSTFRQFDIRTSRTESSSSDWSLLFFIILHFSWANLYACTTSYRHHFVALIGRQSFFPYFVVCVNLVWVLYLLCNQIW